MSEESLNIYQKLAKIRKLVEVIAKDKAGFNYTYVGIDTILARISVGMRQNKLSLIPSIVPGTLRVVPHEFIKSKVDKKTKEIFDSKEMETVVYADMNFRWVNDDNPSEFIDIPWVLTGSQEDPSQALGSALTYCSRYFLLQYFQIATPDNDPDQFRSKQREAEAAENKAILDEIIRSVDEMSKDYVANAIDMEAAKEAILALTSKYVKGGNYKKIDNPNLAAKLLQEMKDTFMTKGE
jgi:hypothetical protein